MFSNASGGNFIKILSPGNEFSESREAPRRPQGPKSSSKDHSKSPFKSPPPHSGHTFFKKSINFLKVFNKNFKLIQTYMVF